MTSGEVEPRRLSRTKIWFLVHSWLALPIWAFLFFVCLTGSIATVSQEIVWLVNPAVRANAPSNTASLLGYDDVLAAVERQRPGSTVDSIVRPVKSQFALAATVTKPDGTAVTLHINPYTGAVQGEQGAFDFQQFVRALHGWLLMPFTNGFNLGWYVVSGLSIPLIGSLITGLVVYKKFWRGFLTPRLRITKGARIFWGDFHRLAGIWSIPFIIIMSVTALWFLIQAILADNYVTISSVGVPPVVAREDVPRPRAGEKVPFIGLDRAVSIARERFPDLEPNIVTLPSNAYGHIVVTGRGAYPLLFERANINPYNGKIEWTRRVADRSGLELVTESMRPLHTGDFAGLWLKLVYFFFGLLLTTMIFSGMMIWTKRTARETATFIREKRSAPRLGLEAAE